MYDEGTEIEICSNVGGVEVFYMEMRTSSAVKFTITYTDNSRVFKVGLIVSLFMQPNLLSLTMYTPCAGSPFRYNCMCNSLIALCFMLHFIHQ